VVESVRGGATPPEPGSTQPTSLAKGASPRLAIVRRDPGPTSETVTLGEEVTLAEFAERAAEIELQLLEQIEIERMRDLELGALEQELEYKSERLQIVEDELFHERRRSAELERRWNVLAASYELTAASLVETGATLAAIRSQRSYRAAVRILRILGRHRRANQLVAGLDDARDPDAAD
jgi:hypothetical protein